MIEPTSQVAYENGIEIRYFEANDEVKPRIKRHYDVRDTSQTAPVADWHEVPSVSTVLKILHKEALISWAQRTGGDGAIRLFNMGVLKGGMYEGQPVLCTHDPEQASLVVVGEYELVELLKKYRLTTNDAKKKGGKRGDACHKALEAWAQTGTFPNPASYPISEQGYVVALEHFLRESGAEAVRSEVVVASARYGFAGRFDLDLELPKPVELQTHYTPAGRGDKVEWFDAGLYRVDLKTAKDVFEEHGEQLEAYEEAAVEDGLPESLQRIVLHCADNSRYKFKPSWSTFEDFEATLRKWRLNQARKARK